jgi:hypothetical protein
VCDTSYPKIGILEKVNENTAPGLCNLSEEKKSWDSTKRKK